MLDILYLVHDLSDPAVRRRVTMLDAGGAAVTLAGFRRGGDAGGAIDGRVPIELGRTMDARFVQRAMAVARAASVLGTRLRAVSKPDVIIARNLEMLALANRANSLFGGDVPIVYECLDIHRLLLRPDMAGQVFRRVEGYLGRNASLLLTSSQGFVDNYFNPLSRLDLPTVLLENKIIELDDGKDGPIAARPPEDGEPWKIGWFGALRCRTSLALLSAVSRRMQGRLEIVLRGRPAYSEFDDFDAFVSAEPYMTFHGAYCNPEELAAIYQEVHFAWAIDFFEAGQNSQWLLPNRLYEGCRFGAIPIAARGTETARYLQDRAIGMVLDDATVDGLAAVMTALDRPAYEASFDALARHEKTSFVADRADCRALVQRLAATVPGRDAHAPAGPRMQQQLEKGGSV